MTTGALTASLFLFFDLLPLFPLNGISAADMLIGAVLDHASQSPEQSERCGCGLPVYVTLHLFQQSGMRSPLRNMCGQSRNKSPYCAVFLTILLGQKVPKTIRSNSGFLKNQHFNQIRRTIHMQNHRTEAAFGAVELFCVCQWNFSILFQSFML